MTDLIVNFATRGRPYQFLKSLENITSTIYTSDYRIIISCDTDDIEMNCDAMREQIAHYPKAEVYYNEPTSKIGAINATIPHFGEFRWLINHSDDFIYVVDHWDAKMIFDIGSVWGNSTDFFAHFSDGFVHDKLPTLNVCGYDYFQRDKVIYDGSYGSVSADAENYFKSQMRGCYRYFPNVYFKHIHPANIPSMEVDSTYRRNDKWGKLDTENYFERMSHGFYVENPVYMPAEVQEHINKRIKNES